MIALRVCCVFIYFNIVFIVKTGCQITKFANGKFPSQLVKTNYLRHSRQLTNVTICFSTEYDGRMGNLMFEYASVVGLCVKHERDISNCVQLVFPRFADPDVPVGEFASTFRLFKGTIVGCKLDKSYKEHGGGNDIYYDEKLMNVESGTKLRGYMQSYKYFHPHAEKLIKSTYTFPAHVRNDSIKFIDSIRRQIPNDHKIVGVHVRRGDKMNNPVYNSWALSLEYYHKAIHLIQARHKNLAFLFFTGGSASKKDAEHDNDWTRAQLVHNMTHSYHEESSNHLVSMQTLSLCDIIITAHSTFSWWSAYLSSSAVEIVAPRHLFPKSGAKFVYDDYYLPNWHLISDDPAEDRIIGYNPFTK